MSSFYVRFMSFGQGATVGQIPKKCKETSNLMWLSMIWFISVLFVCWNLFCTIANLRIKCVTETKNVSVLFYKNVKSSFSTWLTHLTLRFLYILGCSGPRWAVPAAHFKLHFLSHNVQWHTVGRSNQECKETLESNVWVM